MKRDVVNVQPTLPAVCVFSGVPIMSGVVFPLIIGNGGRSVRRDKETKVFRSLLQP